MLRHIELKNQKEWERFVVNFPESNFLQSWQWGDFHVRLGHKVVRSGFFRNAKLVGTMLSVVETGKRAKYLTVPAGPLINWSDKALVKLFLKTIKEIAKKHNCSFVRVRPQIINAKRNQELFKALGFHPAPMHLHAQLTTKINLNITDEQLLKNMRKATRYEIKRALNEGIAVESSSDLADIEMFYKLQLETAGRQAFVPFTLQYFKEQFDVFCKKNQAILYSAKLNGELLAQAFVIFYGKEADYHYGASSMLGRKHPGAYLIQWTAIREAKERGMTTYDLWGIAPDDKPNHRFAGVSLFKKGFGGETVEYLHAHDLVLDWKKYFVNWIVEEIRRRTRGL